MLNNPAGPRNNFGYQISALQLLGAISASVAPPGGLATEATLVQVLSAIQNGKEFEQLLVLDLGAPAPYPTYIQIRIWNTTTHTFDPPIYYNAAGAVVVPIGPLEIVNPQYVLDNILTQVTAINTDLDVALSTRASELTLLATNTILTTISGRLDVNLSTRATEATLASVLVQLTAINADLDVALSTRASEATLSSVLTQVTAINADLDVALSTRASEATLLTRATEATLLLIKAKTDNLDVLLSTRASEATLTSLDSKFTAVVRTPTMTRAAGPGNVAAGARSASFYNAGSGNATVLGATLLPGEQVSFAAGAEDDTLAVIAYNGTGTDLLITSVV